MTRGGTEASVPPRFFFGGDGRGETAGSDARHAERDERFALVGEGSRVGDRGEAGFTAPARGLFLTDVEYE